LGFTSVDKALAVCEALSAHVEGQSLTELARALDVPVSTTHRLLAVLKRRGYVRQDDDTARYRLTPKVLDLGFRLLGRSELKLHAYPMLREYALATGARCFLANPAADEVTYVWPAGPDEVAMHTAYGKEMPSHCAMYFDEAQATRRLSCLRLLNPVDVDRRQTAMIRLGPVDGDQAGGESGQRLVCTCAPVRDYTGREVARVGVFAHSADDRPIVDEHGSGAWELARHMSTRLGHVSGGSFGVTA
jgi:DNA-binding IclR family transcriptional regulator